MPRRPRLLALVAVLLHGPALAEDDAAPALRPKIDSLRIEAGMFPEHDDANGEVLVQGEANLSGGTGAWEYRLGLRFDGEAQAGSLDFDRARLDYGESFVRWRGDSTRVTVGAQNVLWGRVDEISPIDRLSRQDLTRALIERLPERRRATPALRIERFVGEDGKLDLVLLPLFDAAVLPSSRSVWHPVDTRNGRIVGLGSVPIAGARIVRDEPDHGGGGLRFTSRAGAFDYGFSVQRVRQSQPYYRVSPTLPLELVEIHPYSTTIGAELETSRFGATWRMEAAWNSATPLTTLGFGYRTDPSFTVVLGTEFFPGDSETRVTAQLAGTYIDAGEAVRDRTEIYSLLGEVEYPFARGRWRADLRYSIGIGDHDVYLNPRLVYTGLDRHEFYVGLHLFDGGDRTLGGYYRDNDMLGAGWRARF